MVKLLLLTAIILLCSPVAFTQTLTQYTFDNFDTLQGVQVKAAQPKPSRVEKKVKLTARSGNYVAGSDSVKELVWSAPRGTSPTGTAPLKGFSTGDTGIDALISDSGVRNGVDPLLLYAIMHRESSFKPGATSPKGARGLMQLMPGTAARFGVTKIYDSRQNIEGGARYMRFLLTLFNDDVALALAGYNAGEGAVLRYGRQVPPYSETQEYVRRIFQRYALMRDPSIVYKARPVSVAQAAALSGKNVAPVYEQSVFAVQLPDGKLRLVSQ